MAKPRKMWVYSPPKSPVPKVPASAKAEVQQKADRFVETVLKPRHIKPPPEDNRFNYIVDIYTKWYRHYFYFCATYRSSDPDAPSPDFEVKFARLEYVGPDCFKLSFMRHTGEWIEIYPDIALDKSFASIKDDPFFFP